MKNNRWRLRWLPVSSIAGRPDDCYDQERLSELADSIRAFGVMVPVVVTRPRLSMQKYSLLSGGRRVQACRIAGQRFVPALIVPDEPLLCAALELLCDLHREGAGEFRTARLLKQLRESWQGEPAQLPEAVGLSAAEVVSYQKLLTLSPEQQMVCEAAMCGKEYSDRIAALPASARNKLFFGLLNEGIPLEERASTLRDRLGCKGSAIPRRTIAIKDVRIFFNTIDKAVDVMKQSGVQAASERHDYEDFTEYLIRIPLARSRESTG